VWLSGTTLETCKTNLAGKQLINDLNIPKKITLIHISKLEIVEHCVTNKLERTISGGQSHGRDILYVGSLEPRLQGFKQKKKSIEIMRNNALRAISLRKSDE
jgi:hypothetical protein